MHMLLINHYPSVPDPGFPRWGTPTPEDRVKTYYYRPQTKFPKVMFLHLSVSHSVHKGVPGQVDPPRQIQHPGQVDPPQAGTPPGRYTPWSGTPPRQVHSPGQVQPPW